MVDLIQELECQLLFPLPLSIQSREALHQVKARRKHEGAPHLAEPTRVPPDRGSDFRIVGILR